MCKKILIAITKNHLSIKKLNVFMFEEHELKM